MRSVVRLLIAPIDWLSTRLDKLMLRGFVLEGPFLPTSTRHERTRRAFNIDGTPMLSETFDMKGQAYGACAWSGDTLRSGTDH